MNEFTAEQRIRSASRVGNMAWSSLMDACSWAAAVTPQRTSVSLKALAPSSSRTAAPGALAPHRGAADLVNSKRVF